VTAPPSAGEALALHRTLAARADAVALYAALSEQGTRRDTLLIERSVGPTLILDQAAIRVECRRHSVILSALTANGRHLLESVAAKLPDRVAEAEGDRLELLFPPTASDDAEARLTAPSPFNVLRAILSLRSASNEEPFTVALLGILAFDHVDLFEDLPANREDPLDFPDFVFWVPESLVVIDPAGRVRLVCTAFGSDRPEEARRSYFGGRERLSELEKRCAAAPLPGNAPLDLVPNEPAVQADLDDSAFGSVVSRLKEEIARGEVYQIVPSRTFRSPCSDPLQAFARLRQTDPSPYQFFVAAPAHLLFGASPETSVRVFMEEGRKSVEVKPIAGTRPRGATQDQDDRFEADLRLDRKELAEHMMLVDLARNDVARVSIPGTRRVQRLMTVERYARVMHLVSSVTGVLRNGLDAFHALQACLNVGTLSGAPKIRATELLRLSETTKRGPYGGAVGWINGAGLMDTGVIIRSAVVKDGTAFVRAGAGVVHDSDPQSEADETRRKASAVLSSLVTVGECA
jgi:anthranilate synthase component 1